MEETDNEFDERLSRVIAQAETTFYADNYVWTPLGPCQAPSANALACVKDDGTWYEFVPATTADSGTWATYS